MNDEISKPEKSGTAAANAQQDDARPHQVLEDQQPDEVGQLRKELGEANDDILSKYR